MDKLIEHILSCNKPDYGKIEYCLNHGAEINGRTSLISKNTPLLAAAHNTDISEGIRFDLVSYLLILGADPNLLDVMNFSPLDIAIKKNKFGVAQILIPKTNNLNKKDKNRISVLENAVTNCPYVIPDLLKHGADPNNTSGGDSALIIAVRNNLKYYKNLLQYKANVNYETKNEVSAFRTAINHFPECLPDLLKAGITVQEFVRTPENAKSCAIIDCWLEQQELKIVSVPTKMKLL